MPNELALIVLMGLVFCVLLLVCWLVGQVAELGIKVERLEQQIPNVDATVHGLTEPSAAPLPWPTFPFV